MRSRAALMILCSISCGAWLATQGCGDNTVTTDGGNDGTTGNDGNNPPPDSGNQDVAQQDTGVPDTGGGDASDGGVLPDGSSTGLSFSCGNDGGTVTDCAQCTGATQPCVYCEIVDASVHAGECRPFGSSCNFNPTPPTGFAGCPCFNDASTCPESYQVCRNATCRTCSDSTNNNGLKCQSGGTCDNVDGGCI